MTDSNELELYPEPVRYPRGPLINGTVVTLDEGYAREVKVAQPFLAGVLVAAGVTRALLALLVAFLPGGTTPGSVIRDWRELKKGPEYLVRTMRIRDQRGTLCELELHGYLSGSALQEGDKVRGRIRPQRDPHLPPRVERLANLTTGQILQTNPPNLWSHLGPALLLQAVLGGLLLVALIVLAAVLL